MAKWKNAAPLPPRRKPRRKGPFKNTFEAYAWFSMADKLFSEYPEGGLL